MGRLTLMEARAAARRFGELSLELTQQGRVFTGAWREIDRARSEAKSRLLEAIDSGALETSVWEGQILRPGVPQA